MNIHTLYSDPVNVKEASNDTDCYTHTASSGTSTAEITTVLDPNDMRTTHSFNQMAEIQQQISSTNGKILNVQN